MIKVLWIDDECLDRLGELTSLGREVIETAYEKGIDITPESSFERGVERIRQNRKEFCAVILDVRKQDADEGEIADDYLKARREIERMQDKDGQYEPYIFVLSGEKDYQNPNSLFPRMDYCKRVYDKNGDDYELLFEDIIKLENISPLYKTQCEYSDVLTTAKELMGDVAYFDLLKLIFQIVTQNEYKGSSMFNDMRKFCETHIVSILEKHEYPYFVDPYRTEYKLSGLSHDIRGDLKIPVYIQRAFDTLEQVVQDGSHGKRSEQDRLVVDRDVKNGIASYLLRSCLFELLNIIMWLKMWVEAEKNLQQLQQEIMGEMIIGKELPVKQEKNCWSVGKWCKLHKAFIPENDNEYKLKPKVNAGDIIRIRDVMKNDGDDKNKYPFIVTNIELYKK